MRLLLAFLFVSLSTLNLYSNNIEACMCDRQSDSLEVVKMYHEWDGANWTNPWDLNTRFNDWYGLTFRSGCLVQVLLWNRDIKGEIFDFNLPDLTSLILHNGKLSGELPDFSKMGSLENLAITSQKLTGVLHDFTNLPNLKKLSLLDNDLSGNIPDFQNLQYIEELNLSQNSFSGELPNFSNLYELLILGVDNNQLSGEFPNLKLCNNLTILGGGSNQFTGSIPKFLELSNLESLVLRSNNFSGTIPNFSNSKELERIYLGYNELIDVEGFDSLYKLKYLDLASNKIKTELSALNLVSPELQEINLDNNDFTGSIEVLYTLLQITEVSIYSNPVIGEITDFIFWPNLRDIDLGLTEVSGQLENYSNNPNLKYIRISSPNLSGNIPNLSNVPKLIRLNYGGSKGIVGSLPDFSLPNLESLIITYTSLSGPIPSFQNCLSLKGIGISSSNLEGSIPNLSHLQKLEGIGFSENNLSGTIPTFQENLNLRSIRINNNSLSGKIHSFENNPFLTSLWAYENSFDSCSFTPNITDLRVYDNVLSFDDLLKNRQISRFEYEPQKNIPIFPKYDLAGQGVTINLDIDNGIQDNTYRWYINGIFTDSTTTNELFLSNYSTDDEFYVLITNPGLPDLTLKTSTVVIGELQPFVKGKVFKDEGDCVYDNSDQPLDNWEVRMSDSISTYYTRTLPDGSYTFRSPPGTYTIETITPTNAWEVCDNNYEITVNYRDTAIVDIPVEAISECAELQVNVGVRTPIFRRCFDNAFAVNYCNLGTTNEDNVNVEVIIDDWLQVDSFESPIIQENFNGRQRFIIPSTQLEIGECNTSLIHFTPICDAPLGISQCIKAHITPDSLCSALSSTWTGPTIETDTRCNNVGQVALTLRNVGKSIAEDLTYKIYKDGVVVDEVTFSLIPNEFLTIVKNNDNSSWGIECKQVENHPCGVIARSFIEGCGIAPNTITNSFALQFPNDNALCPFNDEICSPIIGSYDPNDKQAFPVGYGSEHYVTPETTIEYLIRFQNVGNDTAFNIYITDSLSQHLDMSSLEILESSHPYQLQIDTNQVMTFSFFDALLVDSIANEPESHGFISYKIGFKADTPLETVVKNKAYIVFDFNDPIITNEVFHTLGRDFIQSDISSVISKSDVPELKVYPNPAYDQITIDLNDIQLDWLRILDINGREIIRYISLSGTSKINIRQLIPGVYFLEGKGKEGERHLSKLLKI